MLQTSSATLESAEFFDASRVDPRYQHAGEGRNSSRWWASVAG